MNAPCTIHSMSESDIGLLESNCRGWKECALLHANNGKSRCKLLLSAEAASNASYTIHETVGQAVGYFEVQRLQGMSSSSRHAYVD